VQGIKNVFFHIDLFIQKYSVPSTLTGSSGITGDQATFSSKSHKTFSFISICHACRKFIAVILQKLLH